MRRHLGPAQRSIVSPSITRAVPESSAGLASQDAPQAPTPIDAMKNNANPSHHDAGLGVVSIDQIALLETPSGCRARPSPATKWS